MSGGLVNEIVEVSVYEAGATLPSIHYPPLPFSTLLFPSFPAVLSPSLLVPSLPLDFQFFPFLLFLLHAPSSTSSSSLSSCYELGRDISFELFTIPVCHLLVSCPSIQFMPLLCSKEQKRDYRFPVLHHVKGFLYYVM